MRIDIKSTNGLDKLKKSKYIRLELKRYRIKAPIKGPMRIEEIPNDYPTERDKSNYCNITHEIRLYGYKRNNKIGDLIYSTKDWVEKDLILIQDIINNFNWMRRI